MMSTRILVLADSHGNCSDLGKIIQTEFPLDYLIFCGDGLRDMEKVSIPTHTRIVSVSGNMDSGGGLRENKIAFEYISDKKIMITHGDMFQVQLSLDLLRSIGQKESADIVLFGHTHNPFLEEERPALFNPGAADRGCYGIITIDKTIRFEHRRLSA